MGYRDADAAFVRVHPAANSGCGVVLVPPFGWDEQCSYRARRTLATTLAGDGLTTLRIDLPGTGDSAGGPWDADLLGAWTVAVASAAAWLRATGHRRVVAVGFGLGGLIALRAVNAGAPIDDMALWGLPASGHQAVRGLKAFGRIEAGLGRDEALPDGTIVAAGFVLSVETAAALTAVDLVACVPSKPAGRRILLLDRDGIAVDEALAEAMRAGGADVRAAGGPGWGRMLGEPQFSVLPTETFATIRRWAVESVAPSTLPAGQPPVLRDELTLEHLRERVVDIPGHRGALPAIFATPTGHAEGAAGLLLNAGPQRRIGPNRMWTETARRWAARGVPTLRIDLGGIGDADPDLDLSSVGQFYTGDHVLETREAVAWLRANTSGRLMVSGLCAGSGWGLHAAVEEPDVASVVLLNPRALVWERRATELRDARHLARQLRMAESWRKVARGSVNWNRPLRLGRAVAAELLGWPQRRWARQAALAAPEADPVRTLLTGLPERGDRVVLVFTGAEELRDDLQRSGALNELERTPNADVISLGAPDVDTHTLRPTVLQRQVSALLDSELDRICVRLGSTPPDA